MKTLYAITHVGPNGLRRLTFANQGRRHYATAAEAEQVLEIFRGPLGLRQVLTESEMKTLAVRAVQCYDHGDAIGIYVQE
jgi:hypothetical protein